MNLTVDEDACTVVVKGPRVEGGQIELIDKPVEVSMVSLKSGNISVPFRVGPCGDVFKVRKGNSEISGRMVRYSDDRVSLHEGKCIHTICNPDIITVETRPFMIVVDDPSNHKGLRLSYQIRSVRWFPYTRISSIGDVTTLSILGMIQNRSDPIECDLRLEWSDKADAQKGTYESNPVGFVKMNRCSWSIDSFVVNSGTSMNVLSSAGINVERFAMAEIIDGYSECLCGIRFISPFDIPSSRLTVNSNVSVETMFADDDMRIPYTKCGHEVRVAFGYSRKLIMRAMINEVYLADIKRVEYNVSLINGKDSDYTFVIRLALDGNEVQQMPDYFVMIDMSSIGRDINVPGNSVVGIKFSIDRSITNHPK